MVSPRIAKAGALETIERRSQSLGLSRQQGVERRGQGGCAFDVVHPPVGDCDDPCDACLRFFGQCLGQGGHQLRAAVAVAIGHCYDAQFGVGAFARSALKVCQGCGRLIRAVADALGWHFRRPGDHDVA